MQEFQQRVCDERDQLRLKLDKLSEFIKSAAYRALDLEEQKRLFHQQRVMTEYLDVLDSRIVHFVV